MQKNTIPGRLANRAPSFSAPPPAPRASGLVTCTVQLQPAPTRAAGTATPLGGRPTLPENPMAPPVYRPQVTLPTQTRMAGGAVNRPQQAPIALQTKSPSGKTQIAGHTLQPFPAGVIQARCRTCGANSHNTNSCPRTRPAPTPTARRTAPSTLGRSHTRTSPTGNFVGHGAQAGAGGHNSGRRRRMLGANLANSQNR
jgi:hypothetical protein